MNVSVLKYCALINQIFWRGEVFYSNITHYYPDVDSHSQLSTLKSLSLSTFVLKSPNRIFMWYLENDGKSALIPHQTCLLGHHFSPHLVHAHSQQWYYTSDLSELYMTSYH